VIVVLATAFYYKPVVAVIDASISRKCLNIMSAFEVTQAINLGLGFSIVIQAYRSSRKEFMTSGVVREYSASNKQTAWLVATAC